MLSNPEKEDTQYYCRIDNHTEFVEKCEIVQEGSKYIANIDNDNANVTETFENMILEELNSKASSWFDISPDIVSQFFLYSNGNIRFIMDEGIEEEIKNDTHYYIHFRPHRLLIDRNSFQVEYMCFSISEDVIDVDREEPPQNANDTAEAKVEETIDFTAKLDKQSIPNTSMENPGTIQQDQIAETPGLVPINIEELQENDLTINADIQEIDMNNMTGIETIDLNSIKKNEEESMKAQKKIEEQLMKKDAILQEIKDLRIRATMLYIQANNLEKNLFSR